MTFTHSADIDLPPGILHWRYDRSSGPGGQNVNKLNTKATLAVDLAELEPMLGPAAVERLRRQAGRRVQGNVLTISSEDSRSQVSNRRDCLRRLQGWIAAALIRPKSRKATRPSAGAVKRRLQSKIRRSGTKRMRSAKPGFDE